MTRIWVAEVGGVAEVTIRLFRSEEDALAWLRDIDSGDAAT